MSVECLPLRPGIGEYVTSVPPFSQDGIMNEWHSFPLCQELISETMSSMLPGTRYQSIRER